MTEVHQWLRRRVELADAGTGRSADATGQYAPLVALVVVAVVGFIVLVAGWTGLKIGIWRFRQKRTERQEQQRKRPPEDKASLPAALGRALLPGLLPAILRELNPPRPVVAGQCAYQSQRRIVAAGPTWMAAK